MKDIRPYQHNPPKGEWNLVLNLRPLPDVGITGEIGPSQRPVCMTHDGAWNTTCWTTFTGPMGFPSREVATEYLRRNRWAMEFAKFD